MHIEKCCFCYSLRTGAQILGIASTVADILGGVTLIGLLAAADDSVFNTQSTAILGTVAALMLLQMVTSILLVYATIKDRRGFMMPWLVLTALFMVAATVMVCVAGFRGDPIVFTTLIGIAAGVYFWYCVFTFYKSLGNTQE